LAICAGWPVEVPGGDVVELSQVMEPSRIGFGRLARTEDHVSREIFIERHF
jgi:hypothetical protein